MSEPKIGRLVDLKDEDTEPSITDNSQSEIASKYFDGQSVADTDIEKDPIQRETTPHLLHEIKENRSKSFMDRNFTSMTSGGIRSSIFTLFSGTVGAGVLSLPHVN